MRTKLTFLISLLLLVSGPLFNARADVNVGVRADESGIKEFYLAIGDHYGAPEKEVVMVRERGIPDDDLPVVYFIARRAGVPPIAVIKLRLEGRSWMDITFHYGLTAEIYYMEVGKVEGPPYGKAYGHFKNKPRKEWNTIKLADADIINFVNLRFLSEHYGYSPDEIVRMRSEGQSFVNINAKVKKAKHDQKQREMTTAKSVEAKSPGKAKEKKK
jgi:hypothetical protein